MTERGKQVTRIVVPIQLVVGNRQEFKNIILRAPVADTVILDFSGCTYVDSSGLGILLQARRERRLAGGDNLRVANLNDNLLTLFEFSGIYKLFGGEPA